MSIIVYRVRPHPDDSALIHVIVDRLFERDCGAGGHVGDNEVFGMTVDPARQKATSSKVSSAKLRDPLIRAIAAGARNCNSGPWLSLTVRNGKGIIRSWIRSRRPSP